jgi:hypothetical protein
MKPTHPMPALGPYETCVPHGPYLEHQDRERAAQRALWDYHQGSRSYDALLAYVAKDYREQQELARDADFC